MIGLIWKARKARMRRDNFSLLGCKAKEKTRIACPVKMGRKAIRVWGFPLILKAESAFG